MPRERIGKVYDHRVDSLNLRASIFKEMGMTEKYIRKKTHEDNAPPMGQYGLHKGRAYHFAEVGASATQAGRQTMHTRILNMLVTLRCRADA